MGGSIPIHQPRLHCAANGLLAPHVTGAVTPEIVEHRRRAVAVPVAGDEGDALTGGPGEACRGKAGKVRAVDNEVSAPGRLHDFDDMTGARQVVTVIMVPIARIEHAIRQRRRSDQHRQRE
jgi:hypothetical protein